MDVKHFVFALTFSTLLRYGEGQYNYYSRFWIIVVGVFFLKLGCISYLVYRKRRRQQMYAQTVVGNDMNMTQQVGLPQPGYPASVSMPPPQYAAPVDPQILYPRQSYGVDNQFTKRTEIPVGGGT